MFPDGYYAPRFWAPAYWGRYTGGGGPVWSAAVGQGTVLDWLQVLKRSFDPTEGAMRMVSAGAPTGATPGATDAAAIFKEVFDPDTNSIRIVEVP